MRADPAYVELIRRALARRPGVELALLFGSRLTGRAGPSSDIDLAIQAPGVDLFALAGDLSAELGAEVDLVDLDLDQASIPLLNELVQSSEVVYEDARGRAASWRARALCALETDLPWFRRMRDAWLTRVSERGFDDGR
jgi:predicted nucleotidyltransferase